MNNLKSDKQYIFITGLLRSFENSYLTSDIINKLIKSESIDTALSILNNTVYSEFVDLENSQNFKKIIQNRKDWLFAFIEKYSYIEELSELFKLEYDYHNIKTLLKEKIFNLQNIDAVVDNGTIDKKTIQEIIKEEKYNQLPDSLQQTVKLAIETYYNEKRSVFIDLILDQGLFNHLLNKTETISNSFIIKYYKLKIDIINVQTLFRVKKQKIDLSLKKLLFLEGGDIEIPTLQKLITESFENIEKYLKNTDLSNLSKAFNQENKDFSVIETASDEIIVNYLKDANYLIWGVEPLFAFSQILLIEFKTIGIVLNAKKANFDPEWIRKKIINLNF